MWLEWDAFPDASFVLAPVHREKSVWIALNLFSPNEMYVQYTGGDMWLPLWSTRRRWLCMINCPSIGVHLYASLI